MIDQATRAEPPVSKAPIWIALGLGLLAALLQWPYALPLALLIGYGVYSSKRSSVLWSVLSSRNEVLAKRVGELEREIAVLKAQVRPADAGSITTSAATAEPAAAAPAFTPRGAPTPAELVPVEPTAAIRDEGAGTPPPIADAPRAAASGSAALRTAADELRPATVGAFDRRARHRGGEDVAASAETPLHASAC